MAAWTLNWCVVPRHRLWSFWVDSVPIFRVVLTGENIKSKSKELWAFPVDNRGSGATVYGASLWGGKSEVESQYSRLSI